MNKEEKTSEKNVENPEASVFDQAFEEINQKQEKQEKKRGRGRPSKKEKFEQEQQKIEMTAVLVAPLVNFISIFLSNRLGEKWKMSKEEVKEGSKVTTAVLNKYMPNFEDKAELIAFAMFWSGYVLTRSAKKEIKNE